MIVDNNVILSLVGDIMSPRSQRSRLNYESMCALQFALHKLGGRWTLLVLRALADGPLHFVELKRRVPQIPGKSLSRVLAKLQRDGLILRASNSVRHIYTMARKDPLLLEIVRVLTQWGSENLPRHPHRT